ncbi:MAG: 30S ribosomal protein S4 [Candidatus Komeilibacteria bacterium]|nr:30S ribosomal protein S4 [Candidatus Komeilibacteria bacterium]
MGRNLEPKSKQERREGVNLFLKGEKNTSPKNPMIKRPYPPGMHGPNLKKGKRQSGYGERLREKQKAKKTYRLLEREFHRYFVKAGKMAGNTSENLIKLLETRLDNVIYRLGFADSRDSARQLVNHGHITVNSKVLGIPSANVNVGNIIGIKPSAMVNKYWQDRLPKLAKVETPGWLSLNAVEFNGKMVSLPAKDDLVSTFDPTLIIEFYSR